MLADLGRHVRRDCRYQFGGSLVDFPLLNVLPTRRNVTGCGSLQSIWSNPDVNIFWEIGRGFRNGKNDFGAMQAQL